jgi:CBS domain-containing protein
MSTIREVLTKKGNRVLAIDPAATVLDAAIVMNEHKIGALVVKEGERVCGMFTERDILQRVVAQRRDPVQTQVQEVMTRDVICCRPHTTLEEARGVMKNRRIRHLPVVSDEGRLDGLISIGDLNAHESDSKELTIHLMEQYILGHV